MALGIYCVYYKYKRVNIYLSGFQLKEAKEVIKKIDVNISEFVRRAIEEYLDKVKKI